jgi:hypothetical protein
VFVLQDPFFWTFIGMFGLLAGAALVSGTKLGRNALVGFAVVMVCDAARIVLVLPFCLQPRFEIGVWNWIVGGVILAPSSALRWFRYGGPAFCSSC